MDGPRTVRTLAAKTALVSVALLIGVTAGVRDAHAVQVNVNIDPGAGADLVTLLGIDLDAIEAQLATEVKRAFNAATPRAPQEYLRSLADAQAFSNKGLGVDYASSPESFVLGAAVGVSLSLGDRGLGEIDADQPVAGVAPNMTVMAGLNFDMIGLPWLTVYGNFFYLDYQYEQLTAEVRNFGLHAQLSIFKPEGDALELLFQWGGFLITTGFEWSYLGLTLQDELETELPLQGAIASLDAKLISTGTFRIQTTANMIPIELTTAIRFLYIAGLYIGVGFDAQLGDAEMSIELQGNMTATHPTDGSTIDLGTLEIKAIDSTAETGKPSEMRIRFLAGAQVNLSVVKLFVQVNLVPELAVSAAAGLRIAY